mmetsp:Transcript_142710/g.443852  ORF Transcript_142710/g.443852 Transcript_142710/m.443852 type:complete len:239 (+) Transcript_142710:295-1011(+)
MLVILVRGRSVLDPQGDEPRGQAHGFIVANVLFGADDTLVGAEHQPLEMCAVVAVFAAVAARELRLPQQQEGLQHFEEAPRAGQRPRILVQYHARGPAMATPERFVEGALAPITVADLLVEAPLVIAQEAYPIRQVTGLVAPDLLCVQAERVGKPRKSVPPEVAHEECCRPGARELRVGELAVAGQRPRDVGVQVVGRTLLYEVLEVFEQLGDSVEGDRPAGARLATAGMGVLLKQHL